MNFFKSHIMNLNVITRKLNQTYLLKKFLKMSLKKVINKGYTLQITSWENDGDYRKTINTTVQTLEEAKNLHQICTTLFMNGGLGNSMDREKFDHVLKYYSNNRELFKSIPCFQEFEDEFHPIDEYTDEAAESFWDMFSEWSGELIGYSDFYDFRVCESVVVTYSPEDIYLEEINF